MKEIKINKLTLHRFQKAENVVIEPQGENLRIYGDNETGKTTIGNAITWLLFDKSVENKKDFGIKNTNLESQKDVVYSVECEFVVDGVSITLQRNFSEKWSKSHKTQELEFKGHTNEYFINTIPCAKTAFTAQIRDWVDEEVFRVLSDPLYFSTSLHWSKQREIILNICGNIEEDLIFDSSEDLAELKLKLGTFSVDDFKTKIVYQRDKLRKEIQDLPAQIFEANHTLETLGFSEGEDLSDLEKGRDICLKLIAEEEEKRNNMSSDYEKFSYYQIKVSNLSSLIANRKQELLNEKNNKVENNKYKVDSLTDKLSDINRDIEYQKDLLHKKQELLAVKRQSKKVLLDDHADVLKTKLETVTVETKCFACGSTLDVDKVEEAKKEQVKKFEDEKSKKLANIVSKGKGVASEIETIENDIVVIEAKITELDNKKTATNIEITKLQTEMKALLETTIVVEEDSLYVQYNKDLAELNANPVLEPSFDSTKLNGLRDKLELINQKLSKKDVYNQTKARIEVLKNADKTKKMELLDIETDLDSINAFYKAKIKIVQNVVDKKFRIAKFKMFNELVNGGLEETCEVMVNNVPFSRGLNNAGRINAGLDIINTLFEYYDVKVPIIVDNAESVTKLIDMDTQMISLIVSEQDKVLRIEKGN